ncbi:MAG: hypothetical protein Q9159_003352 [Coniocarpon cinnabarinum]
MAPESKKRPKPPKQRTTKKAKMDKHRNLMDTGLKAEIKFNTVMAERRMEVYERKAKEMSELFAARELEQKMAARARETELNVESLGEGLLMASGLDIAMDGTRTDSNVAKSIENPEDYAHQSKVATAEPAANSEQLHNTGTNRRRPKRRGSDGKRNRHPRRQGGKADGAGPTCADTDSNRVKKNKSKKHRQPRKPKGSDHVPG